MARKRKLSVGRDAADAPFETVEETEVEETTDRAVHPPFEIVGEIASEIDSTTTAHTELPPPPQESDVYRLEHSTKNTHTNVICKLTRTCRILNEGEDMLDLEQMFFYRCCAAVLGNIESRDRASTAPKDPSFHQTCLQHWAGRENETA